MPCHGTVRGTDGGDTGPRDHLHETTTDSRSGLANPWHEEPDARIAHVRICGSPGRATARGHPAKTLFHAAGPFSQCSHRRQGERARSPPAGRRFNIKTSRLIARRLVTGDLNGRARSCNSRESPLPHARGSEGCRRRVRPSPSRGLQPAWPRPRERRRVDVQPTCPP